MRLTLQKLLDATGGCLVRGEADTLIESFSNDSRSIARGGCFVAIRAERDGHDFIDDAAQRGAVVALTDRAIDDAVGKGLAVVLVDSSVAALAHVARRVRDEILQDASVVGITGSTGKTSTKDLCVAAMRDLRLHANSQSFNNEIGLPLTMLDAACDTDVLILEMGARFRGNIRELCEIARPAIGVITNIGLAHAEHLGGVAGVAATKGELLESLPLDGFAIIPSGEFSKQLSARTQSEKIRVGTDLAERPDVLVRVLALDDQLRPTVGVDSPWGSVEMKVGLRGAHQATNGAMALIVALRCGVEIEAAAAGIATATGSNWRMEISKLDDNITMINDAYNANPTSMRAAIEALASAPCRGRRIAILGAMREIGAASEHEHRKLGALLVDADIDTLICVGDEGQWIAMGAENRNDSVGGTALDTVEAVKNAAEAGESAVRIVRPGDTVLLKASRAIGLESVARRLEGLAPASGTASGDAQ